VTHPRDPHRPLYHFSPDNWMNDPVPYWWDGTYHNFFQYNPHAPISADKHWGHAVSRDLITWDELPVAIAPAPGGPNQDGVWTGCVVEHEGTFYAFHTGIPRPRREGEPLPQVQCLSTSRDLLTWSPPEVVIAAPPPGLGECFRDPQVWREGERWRMVVGSEQPDRRGGEALLYESDDLRVWRYVGRLLEGETGRTGHDFECPDFFPLGGGDAERHERHVFLSSRGRTWWQTGAYDPVAGRFMPQKWGPVDSEVYYAAKTCLDGQGRRLLFGWIRETRSREAQIAAGWTGVQALPRVLSLLPDGSLGQSPAPEVEALRREHIALAAIHLHGDATSELSVPIPRVSGDALEVQVRFSPNAQAECARFGLRVRCSSDAKERTEIAYDVVGHQLGAVQQPGTAQSGTAQSGTAQQPGAVPLALAPGEPLTLRIFVDRSVVETFANNRACYTARTYPDRADAVGVHVFCQGGSATAEEIDVWHMARVKRQ
jgi:beta-fructofuranosidase